MILKWAQSFERDYIRLPEQMRALVEKAIRLLAENPRHPSLHTKKMKGREGIWEARVTRDYRITFQWEGSVILLRRGGTHDILRKE
jgi:mRNA-degrading endonuclease RelE of RelBE toxin-antitoxin system